MTATEIKTAVTEGKTVFWKNENYKVTNDPRTGFLIKSENNENYISLTWADGKTLNGKEEDFYTAENTPKTIDVTIQWKDSKEIQNVSFAIGEYKDGDNDDEIFFWFDGDIDDLREEDNGEDFIVIDPENA